jgi:hypothetical protein
LALLTLLATPSASVAAAAISFDAPFTAFSTGQFPAAHTAGDVDGDGHQDIVTVNERAISVSVLLGRGDGTFRPHVDYPVSGFKPQAIALGDLDGSGYPDIVVAGMDSAVCVLLNHGDGTFAARVVYKAATTTQNLARGVRVVDVTGDGILDIVIHEPPTYQSPDLLYSLFVGHGDGTFAPRTPFGPADSGYPFNGFQFVDINADGKLDFLYPVNVTYQSSAVRVHLGVGNGTFGPAASYPVPFDSFLRLVFGDLNHDGRLDVAGVADPNQTGQSGAVAVLLGNGAGGFGPSAAYPVPRRALYLGIGDLDGDGALDFVTAGIEYDGGPGRVTTLRGRGDGTFEPSRSFPSCYDPRWPTLRDFDEDGHSDVALSCRVGSVASIMHGNGDGTFGDARSLPAVESAYALASGDLNGDGRLDLVSSAYFSITVWLGQGSGAYADPVSTAASAPSAYLEIGDLNGDTFDDLVGTGDSTVSVRLSVGDGTFLPETRWPVGKHPGTIELEDLNHDHHPDLIVTNVGTFGSPPDTGRSVSVLLGHGDGTFDTPVPYATGPYPYAITINDFNGDGDEDIAVGDLSNTLRVFLGLGDGTFSSPLLDSGTANSIVSGDVDGDGHVDLVVNRGGDFPTSFAVLRGAGDGTFSELPAPIIGHEMGPIALVDLDGDGRQDLLASVGFANTLRVFLGHGDGTFEVLGIEFGGPYGITLGDFDQDGRLDFAATNIPLGGLMLVLNRTLGTTTVQEPWTASRRLLLRALPNPSRGEPDLEFRLDRRAPVVVELFDIGGRRVATRPLGALGPGVHRSRVGASDLRAGIYFVRLTAGASVSVARVAVLESR